MNAIQCLVLFWLIPMLAVILLAMVKMRRANARRAKTEAPTPYISLERFRNEGKI